MVCLSRCTSEFQNYNCASQMMGRRWSCSTCLALLGRYVRQSPMHVRQEGYVHARCNVCLSPLLFDQSGGP